MTCPCCGRSADEIRQQDDRDLPITPEHATPICKGGTHDISNIQPMCWRCNKEKGCKAIDYLTDIREELIRQAAELDQTTSSH